MVSFQQLPNELLFQIFDHFSFDKTTTSESCYREDMRTLARISLQCKHFQLLAEPLLYHTFTKPANTETADHVLHGQEVVCLLPNANTRLRKYLRTLLSRSSLAQLVNTLILRPWQTKDSLSDLPSCKYSTLFVPQSEDLLCFSQTRMPLSQTDDFWDDFCAGNEDAEVALLLHLTCDIEVLEINFHWTHSISPQRFYFQQLLQEATRRESERPFQSLRRLVARGFPFNITNIEGFMSLPSVNELITYGASDDSLSTLTNAEGHTNVAFMSHQDSRLSARVLELLVNSCRCLRTFEINYSEGTCRTWREILASISGQSDNFEHLKLDIDGVGRDWTGMDSCFKQFHHLKHLRVSENALLSDDAWWCKSEVAEEEYTDCKLEEVLPSSLEMLTILQATTACLPALEVLLVSLPQGFPDLRTIALSMDVVHPQDIEAVLVGDVSSRFGTLQRDFGASDIRLVTEGKVHDVNESPTEKFELDVVESELADGFESKEHDLTAESEADGEELVNDPTNSPIGDERQ